MMVTISSDMCLPLSSATGTRPHDEPQTVAADIASADLPSRPEAAPESVSSGGLGLGAKGSIPSSQIDSPSATGSTMMPRRARRTVAQKARQGGGVTRRGGG